MLLSDGAGAEVLLFLLGVSELGSGPGWVLGLFQEVLC